VLLFARLPSAFLPTEDQGFLITAVQAPPGATQERTDEALEPIQDWWLARDEVENLVVVRGFSFFGSGQNNAIMFASFKPWDERTADGSAADEILGQAMGVFSQIEGAIAFVIQPPAIQSLGQASGFTLKLQDRGGLGREALTAARDQLLGMASQSSVIANLRPEDQGPSPEVAIDIDRVQARALGLSLTDVNSALSIAFGSAYANDFNRDGRVLQVLVQADAPYRMTPDDVLALRIPNAQGELVPFSAFATAEWSAAPASLARYNGYPAMTLSGMAAPGESSGAALAEMEQLASQLPAGIGYEWTGISYEEKQAGGQIGLLLGLSVVVVFLVLAALYESWAVPLAVLLIVPMGVLGAVLFSMLRGLSADVYFNVGLITIIGLAAKNAILIVEFAIEEEERGLRRIDAVKAAARLRLRPIIMTSLAFTMGMVPLVLASGAGAASRIAVGTGVAGGMIAATVLGIFLIPMLYLLVRRNISRKQPSAAGHIEESEAVAVQGPEQSREQRPEGDTAR
jgi:multidrug efflux pump